MNITNYGQIHFMKLPGDWKEETVPNDDNVLSSSRLFRPSNDDRSAILFYYRGHPVDSDTANAVEKVLSRQGHDLSSIEIDAIQIALGSSLFGNSLVTESVTTRVLNGRIVLYAGGTLPADKLCHRILIPATDDKRVLQEIYFVFGALSTFQANNFVACLESIVWAH